MKSLIIGRTNVRLERLGGGVGGLFLTCKRFFINIYIGIFVSTFRESNHIKPNVLLGKDNFVNIKFCFLQFTEEIVFKACF